MDIWEHVIVDVFERHSWSGKSDRVRYNHCERVYILVGKFLREWLYEHHNSVII